MNFTRMKEYIERWEALFDVRASVAKCFPEASNTEIFFKQDILEAKNEELAEQKMKKIEKADAQIKLEMEQRQIELENAKIRDQRVQKLRDTDWTQLADSPLDTKQKMEYREYRQYIRDIPELFKRSQILELKVMSFDEWKQNKPIYKR